MTLNVKWWTFCYIYTVIKHYTDLKIVIYENCKNVQNYFWGQKHMDQHINRCIRLDSSALLLFIYLLAVKMDEFVLCYCIIYYSLHM